MSPLVTFEYYPKCWSLECDETLNLMYVSTKGRDLEDMLANAEISIEDWHGNEGPQWEIGELHSKDYNRLVELFEEKLRGAHE